MTILELYLTLLLVVLWAFSVSFHRDSKRLQWMADNSATVADNKKWIIWRPYGLTGEVHDLDFNDGNWKSAIDRAMEDDNGEAQNQPNE